MFKRQFVKAVRAGAPRKLKKKPDLVMKMFRRLVKVPLRKILGDSYFNDYDLVARYELAAEKIIKRRRSNHVQSYRRSVKHLPLRYGGVLGICPLTGNRVADDININRSVTDDSNVVPASNVVPRNVVPRNVVPRNVVPRKRRRLDVEALGADFDDVELREKSHKKCCSSCSKKLSPSQIFPKDADAWGETVDKIIFCADCWDKHVQKEMMPLMQERQDKESVSKAKPKKPCKCGSTTHATTRHMDCPLNKRNLCERPEDVASVPPEKVEASRRVEKNKSKTCKCGSTKHKRTTHKDCPLNKKNKARPRSHVEAIEIDAEYTTETDVGQIHDLGSTTESDPARSGGETSEVDMEELKKLEERNKAMLTERNKDKQPKSKVKPKKKPMYKPKIGDNVLAQFKPKKWYLAQVTKCVGGFYSVYFVEDGEVMDNLTPRDIRPVANKLVPTRKEMIGKQIVIDGEKGISLSRWVIRRCHDNDFVCVRLGEKPKGELKKVVFDIGRVTFSWMEQQQKIRELGPKV